MKSSMISSLILAIYNYCVDMVLLQKNVYKPHIYANFKELLIITITINILIITNIEEIIIWDFYSEKQLKAHM